MTAPTPRPVTQAPVNDPRPNGNTRSPRPTTVAGGKAHWDALTTEALATGGLTAAQQANGFNPATDSVKIATLPQYPSTGIPKNLRNTLKTATTADLAWDAQSEAVSYRLRRNGVDVAGATALTALTFHDTGLTTATTYQYTVSSLDAFGTRSPESPAVAVTTS